MKLLKKGDHRSYSQLNKLQIKLKYAQNIRPQRVILFIFLPQFIHDSFYIYMYMVRHITPNNVQLSVQQVFISRSRRMKFNISANVV